jgi:3',5'-nucleoside bisphosphate phosphatase
VATGGSDDHGSLTGHRIGAETTPEDSYWLLMAQASAQASGNEPPRGS